jgi:protein TonB
VNAVVQRAAVTPADRLGLTLFFSLVLHGIIILGLVFSPDPPPKSDTRPPIEIILTESAKPAKVDDAEYLAQADNDGSGNVKQRVRPTEARSAPATTPPLAGEGKSISPPRPAAPPQNTRRIEVLTAKQDADHSVSQHQEQQEQQQPPPSAAELMMRGEEIAKLSAEIHDSIQAYTRRPRERYISACTQSFRDAAYLDAWRQKIERIGSLNYPEEAKRQGLSGNLILDVAINPDGTVNNVELRHSSGYKLLDDAAIRIVKLAAPFAPFSPEMRKDTDVLHITRTWQFLNDNSFASGM